MRTSRVTVFACSNFKEVLTAYISAFVVFFSISRTCVFFLNNKWMCGTAEYNPMSAVCDSEVQLQCDRNGSEFRNKAITFLKLTSSK